MTSGRTFHLSGYILLETEAPCFALPIFSFKSTNTSYMQIVDNFGKSIAEFRPIDTEQGTINSLMKKTPSGVGDVPLYVFVNRTGSPVAGTLEQIREILREYFDRAEIALSTKIQIAALLKDNVAISSVRTAYSQRLLEQGGMENWRSYASSVVREYSWTRLEELLESETDKSELDARRSDLDFFVTEAGSIEFRYYGSPIKLDTNILRQTLEEARKQFAPIINLALPQSRATRLRAFGRTGRTIEILRLLRDTKRQERRASLIFRYAALEPKVTENVLRKYQDRGRIGQIATNIVMDALRRYEHRPEIKNDLLAEGLRHLLSESYSKDRGLLLLEAARALHDVPELSNAIAFLTDRSRSNYVYRLRERIFQTLGLKRMPRHRVAQTPKPRPMQLDLFQDSM